MIPYDITQQDMAYHLKISRKHLIDFIHTRKPIFGEIAQRLAKLFQTSIDFWLQGQMAYDLSKRCAILVRNSNPLNHVTIQVLTGLMA